MSGCLVGPHYRPPVQMMPVTFSEDRVGETDTLVDEDLAHWWTSFDDPFLNDLLEESLQRNFDLLIALERVCQARATYWVQVTGILPELDSSAQATRSRTSQTLSSSSSLHLPPIQSFYQTGIDAIWQIDLFGALRRSARSAYDLWEASAADARGVRIVLLSEVAITYARICSLQTQVAIQEQTIALDRDLLQLTVARLEAGLAGEQDKDLALATLEAAEADLKILETSLRQAIYSLATLLGRPPESLLESFTISRPIPQAAGRIPIGLPSDLLRRRPDVRGAERRIAAATEQIGVAVASLFPQLALTGSSSSFSANPLQGANFGYASNSLSKLLTAPSRIWGIGGLLTWPLFDFGKRIANIDIQISLEHQALLTYEKTVISALQEVEGDLVAYFNEEERHEHLRVAAEASKRAFDLTTDLYQAGLANYTQVVQTQEIWLTALQNLTTSEEALATNLIALYKALGGGWECCYTP